MLTGSDIILQLEGCRVILPFKLNISEESIPIEDRIQLMKEFLETIYKGIKALNDPIRKHKKEFHESIVPIAMDIEILMDEMLKEDKSE